MPEKDARTCANSMLSADREFTVFQYALEIMISIYLGESDAHNIARARVD